MALIDRGVGGEAIQVLIVLHIPHPYSLAAAQDDVQRLVIMGSKLVFEFYEGLGFPIAQSGV